METWRECWKILKHAFKSANQRIFFPARWWVCGLWRKIAPNMGWCFLQLFQYVYKSKFQNMYNSNTLIKWVGGNACNGFSHFFWHVGVWLRSWSMGGMQSTTIGPMGQGSAKGFLNYWTKRRDHCVRCFVHPDWQTRKPNVCIHKSTWIYSDILLHSARLLHWPKTSHLVRQPMPIGTKLPQLLSFYHFGRLLKGGFPQGSMWRLYLSGMIVGHDLRPCIVI